MLKALARLSLLFVALAWALVSTSGEPVAADGPVDLDLDRGVDVGIRPGDDFFAYANGEWLKATEIPAGKQRWSTRDDLAEVTRRRIAELLADAASAAPGSAARQVADFHAAFLDDGAIEARGIRPLRPLLDAIDRVHDKATLTRQLGRGLPADVDPLNLGVYDSSHVLGLAVQASAHGEKTNVAFLLQGGLGLPDRELYLAADPRARALRAEYQAYIGRTLTLSGVDHGADRAAAVMALETALAQSHATAEASAEDHNTDHLWTRADFAHQAPGMDWSAFFAAAGLARQQTFVAWQPGAVQAVAALVSSQPVPVWKDYLRFHAVHRHADVLPHAFADQAAASRAAVAGATVPANARAQRALDATQSALGDTMGRMYVERYFPADQKARALAIVADVGAAFGRRIDAVSWMSPATKATAQGKLKTLYLGMGYPERWTDGTDLVVDRSDAFGNQERVAQRNHRRALARLGRAVDRTTWAIAPQSPGGVLLFHQNALDISAALLQPPKFDPGASDAASYGAIGAVVGHEITHFVDTLGADYEADGHLRRWWTAEDMAHLQAATDALVGQYSAYRPYADLAVDGKLTLTENLADLGGLNAAFDAYRATLGARAGDKAYVRQQDREFFIAYARAWRSKSREASIRNQIATDSHAPDSYRVATVRNLDAWYDAFDVRPGQRLYLEPQARVRIW